MADFVNPDIADSATPATARANWAVAHIQFGKSSAHFEVHMTPVGLLAVGALVSGILLSVVPIVTAATRHLRQRHY
jgi:hypothetical protein